MPPRRPRLTDQAVWDELDAAADTSTVPNLSYTLDDNGSSFRCIASDFDLPSTKRQRVEDLEGAHAQWQAVQPDPDEADAGYQFPDWASRWASAGDDREPAESEADSGNCETGCKRPRTSTPNVLWREHWVQKFVDEMTWSDGLRYHLDDDLKCATCDKKYTRPNSVDERDPATVPPHEMCHLLCCWACGDTLECLDCCLARHRSMPLHTIESWTGAYWEKVSLESLGLIYQLGHGGRPCLYPEERVRTMIVLDRRIHSVKYRYCGCHLMDAPDHVTQLLRNRWFPATTIDTETCATFDILDLFRLASVHANVNTHNFIKVLESETDPLRLKWLPDREKALGRMTRQYTHALRLKRAGCSLVPDGVTQLKAAQLAIRCWACPRKGYNMPEGWDMLDDEEKYRFDTILAMDANFRMKNRVRRNERTDCAFGDGKGLFVETAPYKEHIANYISSCIAFAALAEKDTKFSSGLRVSGVGGIICARHEILQPHGLVDLQKGERYANMDYALCSVVDALDPPSRVVVSYDIGCQYAINFEERMQKLPSRLHIDNPTDKLTYGLPVWHGAIHEEACRSRNSLKYIAGVGRTDGEGIERIWSLMNPVAYATKEMGEGARHDAIEDKGDSINFLKNVCMFITLARRCIIAVDERDIQIKAFKRVNKTVKDDDRRKWSAAISDWEEDRSMPSPYGLPQRSTMSEADVRHQLDAEEMQAIKNGEATVHDASQTSFLVAGLQLEAAQRRILADLDGPAVVPMNLDGMINSRRRAFLLKLDKYTELQQVYMPGLPAYLEANAASEPQAVDAELIPLYLPSAIPLPHRRAICAEGLPAKELKLRTAQAHDTVIALRKKLHAKQYSIVYRNQHVTGQKKSTRARALLSALQERMELDAVTYRSARAAVLSLRGIEEHEDFPPLRDADLRLEEESPEPDAQVVAQYSRAGSSQRPRHIHISTGKHQMSWLWTAIGGSQEVDQAEAERTIACLWSKARARKTRWIEEVELLREDMRRCLRSLEKESAVWAAYASASQGRTPAHASGKRAYALRHEAQWLALRDKFLKEWSEPHGRAKRLVFERATSLTDDHLDYVAESRAFLELNDADAT
ncbi:hypothetical protein FB107DRAFT_224085 [Schizophyllum commune]